MWTRRSQSSISITWKPIFYEPDFLKKNSFSSLNSLIFSSPEPPTIDFQHKINFKHALNGRLFFNRLEVIVVARIAYEYSNLEGWRSKWWEAGKFTVWDERVSIF